MRCFSTLTIALAFSAAVPAQKNIRDSSVFAPLLGFSYTLQLPGGDMVKNYGLNSNIGSKIYIKTKKNFIFGIDGGFLFGNNVKDSDILDGLKTSQGNGFIITVNGDSADVYLYERGYHLSCGTGKIIPLRKPNPNSGIFLYTAAGFLQHKKRIEITGNNVAELSREYRKGYDRLTSGPALTQFIGYQYLSNWRLINFFTGFEFTAAFTKNRRGYNYDTREFDREPRIDLLYGIRFGWILPLYKKMPKDFYFN